MTLEHLEHEVLLFDKAEAMQVYISIIIRKNRYYFRPPSAENFNFTCLGSQTLISDIYHVVQHLSFSCSDESNGCKFQSGYFAEVATGKNLGCGVLEEVGSWPDVPSSEGSTAQRSDESIEEQKASCFPF